MGALVARALLPSLSTFTFLSSRSKLTSNKVAGLSGLQLNRPDWCASAVTNVEPLALHLRTAGFVAAVAGSGSWKGEDGRALWQP